MLSDADLERYSRQLLLPDFEIEQQERLANARVLLVGCGGLGSPLAIYLAAAGVGELVLADGDRVERSNLPRQILHGEADVGRLKTESAAAFLGAHYPGTQVRVLDEHLAGEAVDTAAAAVDLVADASDNYPTRFALNRACIAAATPLVSAAVARGEGQLASFAVAAGTACYRCLYPQAGAETALSCRESGVLGPAVGVLGTLQALEVLKVLTRWGPSLSGRVLFLDLYAYTQRLLELPRRPGCPDCGG